MAAISKKDRTVVSSQALQASHRAIDRAEELRTELGSPDEGRATCIYDLPTVAVVYVVKFAGGGHLGETCKCTRAKIAVKYAIDAIDTKDFFWNDPDGTREAHHMGLGPSGTRLPVRAVSTISVTGCYTPDEMDIVYVSQDKAFRRVIAHAIPTLSSIALEGKCRTANKFVCALLEELIKCDFPAFSLTRLKLSQSSHGVGKAIQAIMQGLWPALQVLEIPDCHANRVQMTLLVTALREGKLKNLRVLNWDNQAEGGRMVSNLILEALSKGSCPRMETISFTKSPHLDRMSLSFLANALQACTQLRELHMDSTSDPCDELKQLTNTIKAGYAPALELLCVRLNRRIPDSEAKLAVVEGRALENAGESRLPNPVEVIISVAKVWGYTFGHGG